MTDIDRASLEEWLGHKKANTASSVMALAYDAVLKEIRSGRFGVDKDTDTIPIAALPEGGIQTGSFALRSYIDADGQARYMISTRGEMQGTTLIGQLERAKLDIYQVLDAPNWEDKE